MGLFGKSPLNLLVKKPLFLILTAISIGTLVFVYTNIGDYRILYWNQYGNHTDAVYQSKVIKGNIPELDLDASGNSSAFPSNIYLVETSGTSKLNPRQACAVESVARCHQQSIIHVYLLESKNFEDNFSLLSLSNVRFIKINRKDFFRDTPLWSWYEKGDWLSSTNKFFEMSDACRYVMAKCLERFKTDYNKNIWGCVGPKFVTKVFKSYCNTKKVKDGRHSQCNITVLSPQVAYPSPYYEWKDYFDPSKENTCHI